MTAPWSENTVTWNNQPGTTSLNQVILPQNTVANQSFIDIDVLGMTQNMMGLNNSNNGFLIKLSNESYYRRMIFASSDHFDVQKHPKLKVCYSFTTHLIDEESEIGFSIYPNPSSTSVKIVADLSEEYNLNVFDVRGRLILNSTLNSSSTLDVSDFSKGLYIIRLSSDKRVSSKKLIIQ